MTFENVEHLGLQDLVQEDLEHLAKSPHGPEDLSNVELLEMLAKGTADFWRIKEPGRGLGVTVEREGWLHIERLHGRGIEPIMPGILAEARALAKRRGLMGVSVVAKSLAHARLYERAGMNVSKIMMETA